MKIPTSWSQSLDPSRPLRPVADLSGEPAALITTHTEPGERWGIQTKGGPVRGGMGHLVAGADWALLFRRSDAPVSGMMGT